MLATVLIMLSANGSFAEPTANGLWLRRGGDAQNTGRAVLPANLATPPREVWRTGQVQHQPDDVLMPGADEPGTLLQIVNGGLIKTTFTGRKLWPEPVPGAGRILGIVPSKHGPAALVERGGDELLLVAVADGRVLWNWPVPEPAHHVGAWKFLSHGDRVRLFIFPAGLTLGHAFEFSADRDQPTLLWRVDYAPRFHGNFGPSIILADMDGDDEEEIVLAGKPAYVGVISQGTGDVKFERHYRVEGAEQGTGRPYGLLQTADIDGDGRLDVIVVACQVEEYLAVLRNKDGHGLDLLWSRFIEKDFPADEREIRPNLHSVADVNGDGRVELVVGAFNLHGKKQWRTLVLDPVRGIDQPLHDWPGRYFWDCFDIDGDGVAEVIVEQRDTRARPQRTTLEARCRTAALWRSLKPTREARCCGNCRLPLRSRTSCLPMWTAMACVS